MKVLSLFSLTALLVIAGCAGTRQAYHEAASPYQTATVVSEHYYSLVKEAADARAAGRLSGAALAKVQAADRAAKPAVLSLISTMSAFKAVNNAQTEADLQRALDAAIIEVDKFIKALKGEGNAL